MSPVDVMLKGRKRLKRLGSEGIAKLDSPNKGSSKSSLHLISAVVTCDEGASPNIAFHKR